MMKKMILPLYISCQKFLNRYVTYIAGTNEYLDCAKAIENIYLITLNKLFSPDLKKDISIKKILYCRDKKKNMIVGCLSYIDAEKAINNPDLQKAYNLSNFSDEELKMILIIDDFAILKEYRKSFVTFSLFLTCYKEIRRKNRQILFAVCEPNLYRFYSQLGFKPLAPIVELRPGLLYIPIYLRISSLHERQSLPSFVYKYGIPTSNSTELNFLKKILKNEKYGFSLNIDINIFDEIGLSKLSESTKLDLLNNAVSISPKKGNVIFAENNGGRSIVFIKCGRVKVFHEGLCVNILHKNDIFGEFSYILGCERTASVVVDSDDCELVFIGTEVFRRIKKSNDKLILWEFFAKNQTKKIISTTKFLLKATP
jgi:hypothetical protein